MTKPGLDLQGKRVIITGAAGGLGRAIARSFANNGAHVCIADINTEGLKATQALIEKTGGTAFASVVDVTCASSCSALAKSAEKALGGVDVLINNAALYGGLERQSFLDIDEDVWDSVMSINVKGVWQVTKALTPLLKNNEDSSIINIASATVFSGSAQWMHYVASKGAVIAMTRVMAKELGTDAIRANVIAPGFTLTEASQGLIEDAKNYGVGRSALGRNAEPEDICGTALYLASSLSKFTTGQTVIVDGGKQFI